MNIKKLLVMIYNVRNVIQELIIWLIAMNAQMQLHAQVVN